jgi:hypothetical protein
MKKYKIIWFILVVYLFAAQSTGYDIYAHALIYYYDYITNSYQITGFSANIPRYFLLSIIYEFTGFLGIPIIWAAILLSLLPILSIQESLRVKGAATGINRNNDLLIYFCVVLIYFYSGLTLSVLWLVAAGVTKRPIFFLGALFHPVGFLIALLFLIFTPDRTRKFLLLTAGALFVAVISWVDANNFDILRSADASRIRYTISWNNINELLYTSYQAKISAYLYYIVLLLILKLKISPAIFSRIIRGVISLFRRSVITAVFCSILFVNAFYREPNSALRAIFTLSGSPTLAIAWLGMDLSRHNASFQDQIRTRNE